MGSNANRASFPHNIVTIAMMYVPPMQNAHSATRNNTHLTRALAKQRATRSAILPFPSLY